MGAALDATRLYLVMSSNWRMLDVVGLRPLCESGSMTGWADERGPAPSEWRRPTEGVGMKPRRLVVALVAVLLGAVAFALPAMAANNDSGVKLEAKLTGKQEVPGPGDRDGSGKAELVVGKKQVCYKLRVEDIERPTEAHIHKGSQGKAGDVVVDLDPPKKGSSKKGFTSDGCEKISSELSKKLRADPSQFYVNVHNKPFPDGAVRGQLREKK